MSTIDTRFIKSKEGDFVMGHHLSGLRIVQASKHASVRILTQRASRLGLTTVAYLWRQPQEWVMQQMIENRIEAILIKTAVMGLNQKHIGKPIRELSCYFNKLNADFNFHICGEGGEYETLVLDAPIFVKRIILDSYDIVLDTEDAYAPVLLLNPTKWHLEDKSEDPSKAYSMPETENLKTLVFYMNDFGDLSWFSNLASDFISNQYVESNLAKLIIQCTSGMEHSLPLLQSKGAQPHNCMSKQRYGTLHWRLMGGAADRNQFILCTEHAFRNLHDHATAMRIGMEDTYQIDLKLKCIDYFDAFNHLYNEWFPSSSPVMQCVEANTLPHDISGEIYFYFATNLHNEALEAQPLKHHSVKTLSTWLPTTIKPYSQIVQSPLFHYVSTTLGIVPHTAEIPSLQGIQWLYTSLGLGDVNAAPSSNVTSLAFLMQTCLAIRSLRNTLLDISLCIHSLPLMLVHVSTPIASNTAFYNKLEAIIYTLCNHWPNTSVCNDSHLHAATTTPTDRSAHIEGCAFTSSNSCRAIHSYKDAYHHPFLIFAEVSDLPYHSQVQFNPFAVPTIESAAKPPLWRRQSSQDVVCGKRSESSVKEQSNSAVDWVIPSAVRQWHLCWLDSEDPMNPTPSIRYLFTRLVGSEAALDSSNAPPQSLIRLTLEEYLQLCCNTVLNAVFKDAANKSHLSTCTMRVAIHLWYVADTLILPSSASSGYFEAQCEQVVTSILKSLDLHLNISPIHAIEVKGLPYDSPLQVLFTLKTFSN